MYEKILEIEKIFSDLNKKYRDDEEKKGINWRFNRKNQDALDIQGVT